MRNFMVGATAVAQCFIQVNKTVGGKRLYCDPTDECDRFFSVRSKTVFDKQLLKDFTNNIWVNGATFQSRAKVYNLNFADSDKERLSELEEFVQVKESGWRLNDIPQSLMLEETESDFFQKIQEHHTGVKKRKTFLCFMKQQPVCLPQFVHVEL